MDSEKMICYNISTFTWVLILIFVGTYGAFKNFKTRQLYKEKTKIIKIMKPPSPIPSSSFSPSHTSSPSPSLSSNSSWHPSYSLDCSKSSSSSNFDSDLDSDFGF